MEHLFCSQDTTFTITISSPTNNYIYDALIIFLFGKPLCWALYIVSSNLHRNSVKYTLSNSILHKKKNQGSLNVMD